MVTSMTKEEAQKRLEEAEKSLSQFGDRFFNLVAILSIDAPIAIPLGNDLQNNIQQILDGMEIVKRYVETLEK